ncbi:MAG: hypothetical protein EZS28_053898, partial [Streblomastix strix]
MQNDSEFTSQHPQQHLPQPTLYEKLAKPRTISPGDPRGYKEKEIERGLPKLQQYAGLMDVVERFHEIMAPIIEEKKRNSKSYYQDSSKNIRTKTVCFHLSTLQLQHKTNTQTQVPKFLRRTMEL